MVGIPAGRDACSLAGSARYYERHRPEQTLLYRIIEQHDPVFSELMAEQRRELPGYVQHEFEYYLRCGQLVHGFLRVRYESRRDEKRLAFSCYPVEVRLPFCVRLPPRRVDLLALDVRPERISRINALFRKSIEYPQVIEQSSTGASSVVSL